MYSFSIWSRKLISSMPKQFRPATIFRIPTCWTDQLSPISNLAPSHSRHHDTATCTRRSRLSACRHGICCFRPTWLGPCPRRRRESRSTRQPCSHCRAPQGSPGYWRGLQRDDHPEPTIPAERKAGAEEGSATCRIPHTRGSSMSLWQSKSNLACEEGR
jgi:hypothetical protein